MQSPHDPARDVVLWASDAAFAGSDEFGLVEGMSEIFDPPVGTTSGIREGTAEDERRLAEPLSPLQAVARRLTRKGDGSPRSTTDTRCVDSPRPSVASSRIGDRCSLTQATWLVDVPEPDLHGIPAAL